MARFKKGTVQYNLKGEKEKNGRIRANICKFMRDLVGRVNLSNGDNYHPSVMCYFFVNSVNNNLSTIEE